MVTRAISLASVAAALACSGARGRARDDARAGSGAPRDAREGDGGATASVGSAANAGSAATTATGDVSVRIEWHDVPAELRAPRPGAACGGRGAVNPTTTWGIPDALVVVDGAVRVTRERAVRVAIDACGTSPRIAVVGRAAIVASERERPSELRIAGQPLPAAVAELVRADPPAPDRAIALPVIGHAVEVAIAPGAYAIAEPADSAPDRTWLIATPDPALALAVTDASGQAIVRDLAVGAHAVVAWLPATRTGGETRVARGRVTIAAGKLAELVLQLEPVR